MACLWADVDIFLTKSFGDTLGITYLYFKAVMIHCNLFWFLEYFIIFTEASRVFPSSSTQTAMKLKMFSESRAFFPSKWASLSIDIAEIIP